MILQQLFESSPGGSDNYAENLAQQVFNVRPKLASEDDILNIGYKVAVQDLMSQTRAMHLFARDQDFPSDFVSAYSYLQKQGMAEGKGPLGQGDLALALDSLKGGWSGWSKEDDLSSPGVDVYHYDDGEGNYYGRGTIEHNLKTGEIKVEYHDSESEVDVDDTFHSIGDAMKAIRGQWGQSHGGKAPNFDRLGQRKQHGPDDLRKTDRTGRKGTLAGGPSNELKRSIQWSKGKHGPQGQLPEQGVAEGSQRVDSLVTDALKIMKGSEASDAVSALKTVLGNREYNDRRGHYNFYVKQLVDMYGQQGVAEGVEDNPVASAITRRILMQRSDLLSKYGPVLVTQAIDEVADFVGDVEEIGSSDVSGWIKQVEQMLANNPPEAFDEGVAEGRHGYDDHGYSLAPGHDEGEPVYSRSHDRRPVSRAYNLVHADTGKQLMNKEKTAPAEFGNEQHAQAVASKLKYGTWIPKAV
jgi:hypothetical protein